MIFEACTHRQVLRTFFQRLVPSEALAAVAGRASTFRGGGEVRVERRLSEEQWRRRRRRRAALAGEAQLAVPPLVLDHVRQVAE